MNNIPAHKVIGDINKPGQIKNTLGEYLTEKYPKEMEKKPTFEEWLKVYYGTYNDLTAFEYTLARRAWEAGLANAGGSGVNNDGENK